MRFSNWDLYSDSYPDLKSEDPADPEPDPDPRINVTRSRIRIRIINLSMVGSGSRIRICISSRITDHIGFQDPFASFHMIQDPTLDHMIRVSLGRGLRAFMETRVIGGVYSD